MNPDAGIPGERRSADLHKPVIHLGFDNRTQLCRCRQQDGIAY
jgi:hypothetical protein